MRGDLSVIGPQFTRERRIAASATRFEAGELCLGTMTLSSGAASANTYALAAADCVVSAGTQTLGGVFMKGALPYKTGTLVAQKTLCACPIPSAGLIRGKAETAASFDTDAEILAVIGDAVLIDYSATGGSDGGELYTIKAASADTSLFQVEGGNPAKSTLDVSVYATIYRSNQDIS